MKTGVIGLGAMGSGMALNLHHAGHLGCVWNRTISKAESFSGETGVKIAAAVAALAAECDLIITCVSSDADVIEVIQAIATAIQPGTVVVDTSTISNETAIMAADILAARQACFLDGPVTGGVEGARQGTLAMMVGGDAAVLEQVREVLHAVAAKIVHVGPCGSGQACKAVNQLMVAGINLAVTEALAFADVLDLDTDKVVDVVATGAAGNWFLEHRGKTMLAGNYRPGFKVNLHHKDLLICRDMARKRNVSPLVMAEMTLDYYQRLMDAGYGEEDISALFRLKYHSPH